MADIEIIAGASDTDIATWLLERLEAALTLSPGEVAISVPGGFTSDGLPVGLQIVGRHQDEWGVLQLAHAFEQATGFGRKRPEIV